MEAIFGVDVMKDGMRRRSLTAAALLSAMLMLPACSEGTEGQALAGSDDPAGAAETTPAERAVESADTSAAEISVTPEDAASNVGINDDVEVSVADGTLDTVTMTATATGQEVTGTLSGDRTAWAPDIQLERSTQYELTAEASDSEGRPAYESVTFTTVSPENSFIGYFTPEDGQQVGVGMPVSFNFDKAITSKAEVEAAVEVNSTSGQEVVGHWFGDTRLDFRPEAYWAAGSQVTVSFDFDGIEGSPGITGVQNDRSFTFDVGRSQISMVDAETKEMQVIRDGREIRKFKISAGADETPTYNGQMVISEKYKETRMNGATVGFTDDDGEGEYDIKDVPHAMRLSTSGTFIHGNYWSDPGVFGSVNTSHGCVGLADVQGADDPRQDGAWFFRESLIGDVVIVVNSPDRQMQPDNGLNGWNMDWAAWQAGSALS